jgi:hypothetical protein
VRSGLRSRRGWTRLSAWTALLLSMLAPSSPARAQSGDHRGREFWIGFLPNIDTELVSVELHLTAELATDVTVEYPGRAPVFSRTVAVTPGRITEVLLPADAANAWVSGVLRQDNAVHAFAPDAFVAYAINRAPYTSDAALAVPVSGLRFGRVRLRDARGPSRRGALVPGS